MPGSGQPAPSVWAGSGSAGRRDAGYGQYSSARCPNTSRASSAVMNSRSSVPARCPCAAARRISFSLSVEAGMPMGWREFVGDAGRIVGLDHFGASAACTVLYERSRLTVAAARESLAAAGARPADPTGPDSVGVLHTPPAIADPPPLSRPRARKALSWHRTRSWPSCQCRDQYHMAGRHQRALACSRPLGPPTAQGRQPWPV
jgi:hypothetical protein